MESKEIIFSKTVALIIEKDIKYFEPYKVKHGYDPYSRLYLLGQDKKRVFRTAVELPSSDAGCQWMKGVAAQDVTAASIKIYKQGFVPSASLRTGIFEDHKQDYAGGYSITMANVPLYTYHVGRDRWSVHEYNSRTEKYKVLIPKVTIKQKINHEIILNRK